MLTSISDFNFKRAAGERMDDLEALLAYARSANLKGQQLLATGDKIRKIVFPQDPYPGIFKIMNPNLIAQSVNVLLEFSNIIFSKFKNFQESHFIRAIDSLTSAGLGYFCKYLITKDKNDIDMVVGCIDSAFSSCYKFAPQQFQSIFPAVVNLGKYMLVHKEYESTIKLFQLIVYPQSYSFPNEKFVKHYYAEIQTIRAKCLLAIGQEGTDEFYNTLLECDNIRSVLNSWVCIAPPSNPKCISQFINTKLQYDDPLIPYFFLHGDFDMIPNDSPYSLENFVTLTPPHSINLGNKALTQSYTQCYQYFVHADYLFCMKCTTELLKYMSDVKPKPEIMTGIFFLHFFLIESAIAVGRLEVGKWYAKQMRTLFSRFPFSVGYALFNVLRCNLYNANFNHFRKIPELEFDGSINWNVCESLWNAVVLSMQDDQNCLIEFENVFNSGNPVLIRESFHFYVLTSRNFEFYPNFDSFKSICKEKKDTYALYIYHQVIEQLKFVNIDELWDYQRPIRPNTDMIKNLKYAFEIAKGHASLRRKIMQLQALISGVSDLKSTSELITYSLSQSFDEYITGRLDGNFKISYPILSIAYFNVIGLDPCFLMSMYHPNSPPFAIRIKTDTKVDDFLDALNAVLQESSDMAQSEDIFPGTDKATLRAQWWLKKRELDSTLEHLLKHFEEDILGEWRGILTPLIFSKSGLSPNLPYAYQTALLAGLQINPKMKKHADYAAGFSLPTNLRVTKKLPISLILGKNLHQIPWESLPAVRKTKTIMTRVPSLRLVALRTQKPLPINVNPRNAFYILNPKGDLFSTEQTFKPVFSQFAWKGIANNVPNPCTIEDGIMKNDLFVYCGHGSGNEFYDYKKLVDEDKDCRATMLLMGCSSGKLSDDGDCDPFGVPYFCTAAGSGAIVGNLWNVTDKEIDRYLLSLLDKAVKKGPHELEESVQLARSACKLKYLTGAAPVIYGFPTVFRNM